MRNKYFLALIILTGSFSVSAQSENQKSKLSYFYSFHAGGLFGKKGNGSSVSFATIHGIRHKRLAFGLGVGYDVYPDWSTAPFFANFSYDLLRFRDNSFFIQLNAGYSKAWYTVEEQSEWIVEEKGGVVIHPLLGYRVVTEKINVYLTAGYKFQSLSYGSSPQWWNPGFKSYVGRDIERISIQLGFGFH